MPTPNAPTTEVLVTAERLLLDLARSHGWHVEEGLTNRNPPAPPLVHLGGDDPGGDGRPEDP